MKFCTGVLTYFSALGLCIYPIQTKAFPFLTPYIQSKTYHTKGTRITQVLQKHKAFQNHLGQKPIDAQGSLWSHLYEHSQAFKTIGGIMQISWPIHDWVSAYTAYGGLIELDFKKSMPLTAQFQEVLTEGNIMIGNIEYLPLYCQLGLLDTPVGLHASAILPAHLMYAHQVFKAAHKKIGVNFILASYPFLKQTQANLFCLYDPHLMKVTGRALSGGMGIYCPWILPKNLILNTGGSIYILNINGGAQWNFHAEMILKFWRIYFESTVVKNDRFAWHVESSMHFTVLQHPVAIVALFEKGIFGVENIYNNCFIGTKIHYSHAFHLVVGYKVDFNQLVHRIEGRGDAWSKLTHFIARVNYQYD